MVERFTHHALTWVNLKNPTTAEVQEIMTEFGVSPTLMGDFTSPVPKNSVAMHDGMIKLTLDFPVVKRIDIKHPYEVKFIVSKQTLITAHYEEMEAVDKFKKQLEVLTTLNKTSTRTNGAHLFFALLNELYGACGTKLDYVESLLGEIEAEIFNENEHEMVIQIADASKKLISFRHILKAHDVVLRDVQPLFQALFKSVFATEMQGVHATYFDLLRRTEMLYATLVDVRETNMGMLTTKQNEIMKTLTIMAFVTFPLTLFSSVFGMNTVTAPIIGEEGDFWVIIGIMSVVAVCFFAFFKYKRWF